MYIMGLSKGLGAVKLAIDEGILPNRRLAFVPTAAHTAKNPYWVEESRVQLTTLGLDLFELDIHQLTREESLQILDDVDGIYFAGGNTFFLLQELLAKDLVADLVGRVRSGFPYFGESAGAVLLCESIEPAIPLDDPSDAPKLTQYAGLGLTDFFILPHVDREKYRDLMAQFVVDNQASLQIVQIGDAQAVITRDGSSYEIVDSILVESASK